MKEERNISFKIMVGKSEEIVCWQTQGRGFLIHSSVSLFFLGFVVKQFCSDSMKVFIDQLHDGVRGVDGQYFQVKL